MKSCKLKNLNSTLLAELAQKAHQGKIKDIENYNALVVFASTFERVQNNGEVVEVNKLEFSNIYSFTFEINNGSKFKRSFIYVQEIFTDTDEKVSMLKVLNTSFEDCNPPSDEFSSNQTFWYPVIPNNNETYLFINSDLFLDYFNPVQDNNFDESFNYGESNYLNYYEDYLKKDRFDHSSIP